MLARPLTVSALDDGAETVSVVFQGAFPARKYLSYLRN